MKRTKKQTKWIKFRHRIVRDLVCLFLKPYSYLRYGVRVERFKQQGKRNYLVLYNHQTAFDQFFVGMCFRGPVYYVASEDIFSNGWVSSLIRYLVNPIPIKKQTTDLRAIMNCIRVSKEGGTVAIAPEGNRTFHGKPVHMAPAIAQLAKKLGLPIAICRIEGGFGVQPRWSDAVRRGKMRTYVSCVIEPEEYGAMTDAALYDRIREELNVDEACVTGEYRHKRLAEYIERVLYVCPKCGLTSFESHGDTVTCQKCGLSVRYLPTKELDGGEGFPFRFLADWYAYQEAFVNALDPTVPTDRPLWEERADLREEIPYKKKVLVAKDQPVRLWGDRIEVGDTVYPFDELSGVTVLGRNKLNLYHGGRIWQLKPPPRFNAVKYLNLYTRYKNVKKGDPHDRFLGL